MELAQVLELLAQSGDGVMVAMSDGRIASWNQAAGELVGYSPDEALGRPCFSLLQGTDRHGNLVCFPGCAVMTCARQREAIRHYELSVAGRDGHRRWLDVSIIPLRDANDQLVALAHIMHATSAPDRLERLLEETLHAAFPALSSPVTEAAVSALTSREREVLLLLSQGASTAAIATKLVITPKTVRNHLEHIFAKLGVHSRLEATALIAHRRPPSGPHAPPNGHALSLSHPPERPAR